MQRASVSVPANIAEGFKRRGRANKVCFYNIAQGSLEELRYYFILCRDRGYKLEYEQLAGQADQISRMLRLVGDEPFPPVYPYRLLPTVYCSHAPSPPAP